MWVCGFLDYSTFAPRREYSRKYRSLRKSNLKECYIVRYADDFKLFCRKRSDAVKLFEATKQWLKERLGLEISPEKSKIVNLKRHYSDFLGYQMKVHAKGKTPQGFPKYVVTSRMGEKAYHRIDQHVHDLIKELQHTIGTSREHRMVSRWNSYILGVHNYYQFATNVNLDFSKIAFSVRKSQKARLRGNIKKSGKPLTGYLQQRYGKSHEIRYLNGYPLLPLSAIQHRNPMNFNKSVNSYTVEGRQEIHRMLEQVNIDVLRYLLENPEPGSMEFNDNCIAVYCAQKGTCAISHRPLMPDEITFCRIKEQGHADAYSNIVMIHWMYLPLLTTRESTELAAALSGKERSTVNKLRKKMGLAQI